MSTSIQHPTPPDELVRWPGKIALYLKRYQLLHKKPYYSSGLAVLQILPLCYSGEIVRWFGKIAGVRWQEGGSIILPSLFAYFFGNEKSMSQPGLRAIVHRLRFRIQNI